MGIISKKWAIGILLMTLLGCFKKQDVTIIYSTTPTYSISGTVVDIENDIPVAEAFVTLTHSTKIWTDTTDSDGNFAFDELVSQEFFLRVHKSGFAEEGKTVLLSGRDIRDLIVKLSKVLNLIAIYPAPGPRPSGITWDGSHIWSCDQEKNRIYKHDASMNVVWSFKSPAESPAGLACDGTYLWVCSHVDKRAYRILLGDTVASFWAYLRYYDRVFNIYHSPMDVDYSAAYLWACDFYSDQITKHDPADPSQALFSYMNYFKIMDPAGIAWADTLLWVIATGQIYKLKATGQQGSLDFEVLATYQQQPGRLQACWDGQHLWIVNYSEKKFYKYSP